MFFGLGFRDMARLGLAKARIKMAVSELWRIFKRINDMENKLLLYEKVNCMHAQLIYLEAFCRNALEGDE